MLTVSQKTFERAAGGAGVNIVCDEGAALHVSETVGVAPIGNGANRRRHADL